MPCGGAIRARNRVVDPVHLRESLRPVLDGTGDGSERLARLLDDLARVVNDAPAPARTICGVDTAATCTGLPPTPALASAAAGTITKAGGLSRLHRQPPPVQLVSVEFLDRLGRFGRRHLDEAEAA